MSESQKRKYLDPIYCKNYVKGMKSKPNKQERLLKNLLNKIFPDQYKYVGNCNIWIRGKNPDFINKEEKKIIELFGDYWHGKKITGISKQQHETKRTNHFKNHGYETLIVWEHELKDLESLKRKLENF